MMINIKNKISVSANKNQDRSLKSKNVYKIIFNLARDGIAINELPSSGKKGKFLIVNKAVCKIFGYSKKELLEMTIYDLLDEEAQKSYIPFLIKKLQKTRKSRFKITIKRKDGKKVPIEINAILIPYKGRYVSHSIIRDISKQIQLEEALFIKMEELNISKQKIKTILENMMDAVVVLDASGKCIFINNVTTHFVKYFKKRGILYKQWLDFLSKFLALYEILDENGKTLPLEQGPALRALRGEKKPGRIIQVLDKLTKKRRWWMVRSRPLFNKNGILKMVITIYIDITEKREAEFLKDEFMNFAGHELKTPLTSIKAYGQILHSKIVNNDQAGLLKISEKFNNQIDLLETYIGNYLDMNKIQAGKITLKLKNEDIHEIVTGVGQDLQNTFHKHKLIFTSPHQKVLIDKERIIEVLSNLIINAVKYSPKADKVYINVKKENKKIVIGIKDFGIGIPKEQQGYIFDRFWQVKYKIRKNYGGLGLGLYIAKGIVENHGGTIWIKSNVGKGTTFFFSLPIKNN